MPSPTSQRIAAGGQPDPWRETFPHPVHGDLTFVAPLPLAKQLIAHSVAIDNLLVDLSPDAEPRFQTKLLAAALAGMTDSCLIEMPVIDRQEVEDGERGSTRIDLVRYDPATEPDTNWLTDVWISYSAWRAGFLTKQVADDVGESSGETSTSDSDTASVASGASPSTTPG